MAGSERNRHFLCGGRISNRAASKTAANTVMLATTRRLAILMFPVFIVLSVRWVEGRDSLQLSTGSFRDLLSRSVHRHSAYFKRDTAQRLCDLDTSSWVASSEPLIKILQNNNQQQSSPQRAPSGGSSRKQWFQDRQQKEEGANDTLSKDAIDSELLEGVTSPLMPNSIWERLTGREFNIPASVERLAKTGYFMATSHDDNDWVDWKPANKETTQALERGSELEALNEDHILVYIGHPRKEGFGSHMPFVKTKAVVHFSAKEVAELLLDSSRVQSYNKFSLGRTDVTIIQRGLEHRGPLGIGETKVVQNLAQPPITNKKMLSVTLMHARPLPFESHTPGYLVVSRALGGNQMEETNHIIRNYVLLGVNLMHDVGSEKCIITSITHLYSPSLPGFLAARFGVKSAVKFVRDIRQLSLVKAS